MASEREKEELKKVPSRLYTTEIIESLKKDISEGYEVDMRPFYDGDYELRNARITFLMTPEEKEEYEKCFMNAMYFITKYCKFMTDNGRRVVKLRDYQKDLIHLVTDQHYDPGLDEMIPDNKNVIIMASRQVGKCCNQLTMCKLQDKNNLSSGNDSNMIDIFDKYKNGGHKILHTIKRYLLKIYNKL